MKLKLFVVSSLLALTFAACQTQVQVKPIPAENFQKEIDGKSVNLYTLTNANGMTVQVTNYGTRIVSLWVPDKHGSFRDVVLGRNTIDEYLTSEEKFYGATVGRYANRIAKGQFSLDSVSYSLDSLTLLVDSVYQLDVNDGENHLHGGSKGFFSVVFDAEPYKTASGDDAILFTYRSPDGEMGYPGNLEVNVRMVVPADKNEVQISYEATTDAPTVVNLSHHSYFNLSGEGSETILDHVLQLNASNFTPTDATLIPTGEILPVAETPLDFTVPYGIGERIEVNYEALALGGGYDHNWVLNKPLGAFDLAADIVSPVSGIRMEVYTDEPGIQFYSGNFMTGNDVGKSGKPYGFRSAFCLETQKFPDSPNHSNFPSTLLLPGETYNASCTYSFSVKTE
jgi:aldose 1-epimerase